MVETITHPSKPDTELPVEIVDEESHRGNEMVQLQAYSPNVTLRDKSGESPWVFREELN